MPKTFSLSEHADFGSGLKKVLVHDSYNFKVLNFNLEPGHELPVHSHDADGEVALLILEGEGEFLGKGGAATPAGPGDVLVAQIREPHGVRATTTRLRVLATIAPPV